MAQLPLTRRSEDGTADQSTSVGDVYAELEKKQLAAESLSGGFGIYTDLETTDETKMSLKGHDFIVRPERYRRHTRSPVTPNTGMPVKDALGR